MTFLALGFREAVRGFLASAYQLALGLGGPGLFLVALADSSFLSLPEGNDLLIVVLSIGQSWELMCYYVIMTTLGSVCGCAVLYGVGHRGGAFIQRRLTPEKMQKMQHRYRRWGVWTVFLPCMMPPPMPFKIFVLSAGIFGIPFFRFLMAVALGRSIRYFSWGLLAVLFGESAKRFIEENLVAVGTVVLILLVVAVSGYGVLRSRGRRKSPQHGVA